MSKLFRFNCDCGFLHIVLLFIAIVAAQVMVPVLFKLYYDTYYPTNGDFEERVENSTVHRGDKLIVLWSSTRYESCLLEVHQYFIEPKGATVVWEGRLIREGQPGAHINVRREVIVPDIDDGEYFYLSVVRHLSCQPSGREFTSRSPMSRIKVVE